MIAKPLTGIAVLFVEDDPDLRELITRLLEGAGARVTVASDGLDGIEKAKRETFDVVVIDLVMPGTDGLSVLAWFRQAERPEPVVILTALAVRSVQDSVEKEGGIFLPKPIQRAVLIATIKSAALRGLSTPVLPYGVRESAGSNFPLL